MQEFAQSHQNDRPGQESAQGDPILGDLPEAQEIDLRPGFVLEDAKEQKVQLQRHKTGWGVGMSTVRRSRSKLRLNLFFYIKDTNPHSAHTRNNSRQESFQSILSITVLLFFSKFIENENRF